MRPIAASALLVEKGILGIVQNIQDLNGLAFQQHPAREALSSAADRQIGVTGLNAIACQVNVHFTLTTAYGSHIRRAQARRRLHDGIEDRLQIELRAADDIQHIARRSLILQRLR